MMQNYLIIFMVCSMLILPLLANAQLQKFIEVQPSEIEGFSVFPNPLNTDKLYITTKHNLPKTIEIYDVLGKRIMAVSTLGKSITISRLLTGLYILKIKENAITANRKLVVR